MPVCIGGGTSGSVVGGTGSGVCTGMGVVEVSDVGGAVVGADTGVDCTTA